MKKVRKSLNGEVSRREREAESEGRNKKGRWNPCSRDQAFEVGGVTYRRRAGNFESEGGLSGDAFRAMIHLLSLL